LRFFFIYTLNAYLPLLLRMKIQLRKFLNVSYVLATLCLVIIGIAIYRSNESVLQRAGWVAHTHRVIEASSKLSALLKDAEIGQQGFLLSSDSTYLTAYQQAIDSVPAYTKHLRLLTRDNPEQTQLLQQLETQIYTQLSLLGYGLTLESEEEKMDQKVFFQSRKSSEQMKNIHLLVNQFISTEENLLQVRSKALDRSRAFTKNVIFLVILAAIVFSLVSLVFVARQMQARDAYDKELQRLNHELAASYDELQATHEELTSNTEELILANKQLEALSEELEVKVRQRTATLEEILNQLTVETAQHKQTAEALRESEKWLRIALENAPVIVFSNDTDLRFTWMYSPFLNIFGRNNEVIGKRVTDFFPNQSALRVTDIMNQVLDTGQGVKEEVVLENESRKRWYTLSLEPITSAHNLITGITGAAYEITEIKQSEDKLKQTLTELENRNKELDHYVYKVSHDLRAPLTSMMGLVALIEMESDPEKIAHYVQLIKNRLYRSDDFIQSVLDHSRNLNSEVKHTVIHFREIIDNCVDELKYLPHASNLQLRVKVGEETVFCGDKLRVSIIFKNFISNAIKYLNPQAEVPYLRIDIRVTPQQAHIRIEDNGIGIEKQYLDKIFNMFFRATNKADGSGLGLYITRQTIEKLQGSISVESSLGKGTTFLLTLPNLQPHGKANVDEQAIPGQGNNHS